ncbi:nitrilase-related carbon-nitrogen hydrolase [Leptospira biflexa]|uniref:nitrilase-related carbon-nitrogen hydrolase n=1 Tax=Leptospira biflexa TaxID=172 RepID=UPI001083A673|nr:nitrilase-related carbon-nitrogen hydrolase [Leptospira biflexa]TGM34518.1 acyltransferase [Leptospira biflexa]TGM35644.1 acyltransferase [Leptospira biflexa]TGM57530.1 acyltransferase [Leptospira biflexa]
MKPFSNKVYLLMSGSVLFGFVGMNWNVPIFVWFAFVPFLRYVRLGHSYRSLLFALVVSQILSTLRIVSEPFHIWIALFSGVQAGIIFTILLWVWNYFRIRYSKLISPILLFAFLFTVVEWIGAYDSDLGVWGMMANSQIGNLILLQSVSLFGATGISFIIYLFNICFEQVLSESIDQKKVTRPTIQYSLFSALLIILLYFYGTFRLSVPIEGKQIKVATITSKYEIQTIWKDPSENEKNTQLTIDKTSLAAKEGAKVVVWNEGAVLVFEDMEQTFLNRVSSLAKENQIEIVAAYIVQKTSADFYFDNKLVWFAMDGSIRQTYFKQFLVPGEPVTQKHSEIEAFETNFGKMSVAICYDFDSLRLTETHAKLGSGMTLIPASDWKGISPFHTEMAVIRGIENGSSIVRSARSGLSGVFDAYGRTKGALDYFEENDGILVTSVGTTKLNTLYSLFGNWIIGIGILYLSISGMKVLYFVIKNRIK